MKKMKKKKRMNPWFYAIFWLSRQKLAKLGLSFLFFGRIAPALSPAQYCSFSVVNLQLLLNAVNLQVFMHWGDRARGLGLTLCFSSHGVGDERAKVEWVSEALQFSVIVDWR